MVLSRTAVSRKELCKYGSKYKNGCLQRKYVGGQWENKMGGEVAKKLWEGGLQKFLFGPNGIAQIRNAKACILVNKLTANLYQLVYPSLGFTE